MYFGKYSVICLFFYEVAALFVARTCFSFLQLFFTPVKSPALFCPPVRDRVRTKMERDILADVNHPFVVKLHYGESASHPVLGKMELTTVIDSHSRKCPLR